MPILRLIIRHWLPIITFCPVNKLPDFIYVSVVFEGCGMVELYAVRKQVRKMCSGKTAFMEEIALMVAAHYPAAKEVHVRLAFSRHEVVVKKEGH